jgi:hypothetical protein
MAVGERGGGGRRIGGREAAVARKGKGGRGRVSGGRGRRLFI